MRIQIKGILALSIALTATAIGAPNNGVFKDSRDGKTYKTVKIGKQIWMAENMNYQTNNSYCYENDPANCEKYGRLYTWKAALNACPSGWHLPTDADFEILVANVGGEETAGKMLKSTTGWNKDGNGIDAFGFNAFPAGARNTNIAGGFSYAGTGAGFWSATENGESYAYFLYLGYHLENALLGNYDKISAYSVRCLRD